MRRLIHIALICTLWLPLRAQEIFEVSQVDTHAQDDDYSPVLQDSGFVMCSIRENAGGAVGFTDSRTNLPLSDLYWVPYQNGITGTPVIFSANLSTPVNEGPSTFNGNGDLICYTRNLNLPKKLSNLRNLNGQLGLFFSELREGNWTDPIAFEFNSTKHSVLHPALSVDGQQLVFASDMEGGLGGMDLYRCERSGDSWSEPVNLGPTINTEMNEVFPSIDRAGMLYFSSDRPGGKGQLDILSAPPRTIGWSSPTFLAAPVNSEANDYAYSNDPLRFFALFSSNRDGKDRIYRAKKTIPKFRDCVEQELNNYCYAARTYPRAIAGQLPLEQVWDMGDGTRIPGNVAEHCYDKPGRYTVRILLIDKATGAIFHELSQNELVIESQIQAFVTAPDTVRTGRTLALDGAFSHVPGSAIAEYHWDFGDSSTITGNRVQHKFAKAGVYNVRLDLVMEPRSDGLITNKCNMKRIVVLDRFRDSDDMAVVATYQDATGQHTFEFQELPFDQMDMAAMVADDATFAVELFASKNRISLDDPRFIEIRKLYRVVERFDPERAVYTYSVGETNSMEELYEVFKKVRELEFMEAEVFALTEEKLVDMSQLQLASLDQLAHTKLITNSIHFEFGSSAIGEGSEAVLIEITGLLRQHPQLQLIIEAHTDNIGGDQYNFDLSQERAASVVKYLVGNDISDERLMPIGHGENQPLVSNKTEKGRGQNRRVEFRMVVKGQEQATATPGH
ncbi:MAG: PKD domain-containing protein [Flavobacteriales bacterium]